MAKGHPQLTGGQRGGLPRFGIATTALPALMMVTGRVSPLVPLGVAALIVTFALLAAGRGRRK